MFELVLRSKSGSIGILVKDLPRGGESGDDWGVGLGPVMIQTGVKVRGYALVSLM